eukprot:scaffold44542_cov275-Isochrysis_galbana.AAC.1
MGPHSAQRTAAPQAPAANGLLRGGGVAARVCVRAPWPDAPAPLPGRVSLHAYNPPPVHAPTSHTHASSSSAAPAAQQ